jgi:hypothetical protein
VWKLVVLCCLTQLAAVSGQQLACSYLPTYSTCISLPTPTPSPTSVVLKSPLTQFSFLAVLCMQLTWPAAGSTNTSGGSSGSRSSGASTAIGSSSACPCWPDLTA